MSPNSFRPYDTNVDQLEYMEECFALVALMIRGNAARMKVSLLTTLLVVALILLPRADVGRHAQRRNEDEQLGLQRRSQARQTRTAGLYPLPASLVSVGASI
jgi:hypothetical protein